MNRKVIAGIMALALTFGSAAALPEEFSAQSALTAQAAEWPIEDEYYHVTGHWEITYSGEELKAAVESGSAQLAENDDGTYTFGTNIQVGHFKNLRVTLTAYSSTNNIYDGPNAFAPQGTFYTVQSSWNADAPADMEMHPVKFSQFTSDDGEPVMKKGSADLVGWDSGPTAFNGQWAQIKLTDDDLDGITVVAEIDADSNTTVQYHPVEADREVNDYTVFRMFAAGTSVNTYTVYSQELNDQIEPKDEPRDEPDDEDYTGEPEIETPPTGDYPVENCFYPVTGSWQITYTGDELKAAVENESADLAENENGTYSFGTNMQVGHFKNLKVTLKAYSTKNNIYNGEGAEPTDEGYLYTVQASWNADAPADMEKHPVKFSEETSDDGEPIMKKGAVDLNSWDSGNTKFNGQWAQITLTDDDVESLTIVADIVADEDTTLEYHPVEEDREVNDYTVFSFFMHPNIKTYSVYSQELNDQIEPEIKIPDDPDEPGPDPDEEDKTGHTSGGDTQGDEDHASSTENPPTGGGYGDISNDLSKATVTGIKDKAYTGKAQTQDITVKSGSYTLHKDTEYTVTYKNNVNAGTASVIIEGKGYFEGKKITKTFKITAASIAKTTVSGVANKVYTGKAIKPTPTVKLSGKTLKSGTDYTVSYKNNTKVGKATVTIKGKGNYTGTVTKTFKINPKASGVSKLTSPKKGQLKATYKKVAGVTGYQVTYSTSSKFTKSKTKTVTVKGAAKTSKTLTKLTKGKKYYVKVRSYKTVGGTKYYSAYSKVKSIKVK